MGITAAGIFVSYLLSYEMVNSSAVKNPVSRYSKMLKDIKIDVDLVEKFVDNLKKFYLKTFIFRMVIYVGGSAESLYKVKSMFEDCPSVVYADLEKRPMHGDWFNPMSLFLIFLDEIREETLLKNDAILRRKSCSILYVTKGTITERKMISLTYDTTIKHTIQKIKFAQFNESLQSVKLYGYSIGTNCSMKIRTEDIWTPVKPLKLFDGWLKHLNDFKGCKVTASSCNFVPKMNIEKLEDGSDVIRGGSEGDLLLTLAKSLNFTLVVRSPSKLDQSKYSRRTAIVNDIISGRADLGINGLRNTLKLANLHTSVSYDTDCTLWIVPRKTEQENIIPFMVFSGEVWSYIGLVYIAICLFFYLYRKIDSLKSRVEKNVELSATFLDVVALHFGNSIENVPFLAGGRIILMLSLGYALILTTAFKTSLASILTTDTNLQVITDAEGIVEANLSVGGATYNFDLLKDQINESATVAKLVDKFVVINNFTDAIRRLNVENNFAFLSRRSSISYQIQKSNRAREPISYTMLNECVLKFYTVIVFRKNSQLFESINHAIMRLRDFGIINYWVSTQIESEKRSEDEIFNNSGCFGSCENTKFRDIFFLYLACVGLSISIFLIELFVKKINLNNFRTY